MKSSSSRSRGRQPGQARAYIAALPAEARNHMQKLRAAIRAAAPTADESFGYGMPAFSVSGKPFVWYGAWKKHSSFYPVSQATRRALAAELKGYKTPGRGTIQFRFDDRVPTALVKRLVKARVAEIRSKKRALR